VRVSIAICCIALLGTASELGFGAQSGKASATVGPQVGSAVPPFSGTDQFGKTQKLEGALGAKGAMLVFYRSADW
jgi:hypothetical protein